MTQKRGIFMSNLTMHSDYYAHAPYNLETDSSNFSHGVNLWDPYNRQDKQSKRRNLLSSGMLRRYISILDNKGYRLHSTYRFSVAAMITRKRLIVMLHVHCLSSSMTFSLLEMFECSQLRTDKEHIHLLCWGESSALVIVLTAVHVCRNSTYQHAE